MYKTRYSREKAEKSEDDKREARGLMYVPALMKSMSDHTELRSFSGPTTHSARHTRHT